MNWEWWVTLAVFGVFASGILFCEVMYLRALAERRRSPFPRLEEWLKASPVTPANDGDGTYRSVSVAWYDYDHGDGAYFQVVLDDENGSTVVHSGEGDSIEDAVRDAVIRHRLSHPDTETDRSFVIRHAAPGCRETYLTKTVESRWSEDAYRKDVLIFVSKSAAVDFLERNFMVNDPCNHVTVVLKPVCPKTDLAESD